MSASGLGPLLLLRVEGRQVDGKGEEGDPASCRRCLRDVYHHESAMTLELCMVRLTKAEWLKDHELLNMTQLRIHSDTNIVRASSRVLTDGQVSGSEHTALVI